MSSVDFSVNYIEIDSKSPVNQKESHIHKECEIYLNLSGNVSFEVENRIYPVSRGSVIITRPLEYHHCIYHSNELHRHFWITFSATEQDSFFNLFFERNKGQNNLIQLNEQQLQACSEVLNTLLETEDLLLRRISFLQLIHLLKSGSSVHNGQNKLPADVTKALQFMDNHLAEELNIKTLAAVCNVSVNTLERHFKESFGYGPSAMLRKKRLILSMDFLRKGDTVTEAALKSAFSDYSHYIQLFRKQFGLTPLQYKKTVENK